MRKLGGISDVGKHRLGRWYFTSSYVSQSSHSPWRRLLKGEGEVKHYWSILGFPTPLIPLLMLATSLDYHLLQPTSLAKNPALLSSVTPGCCLAPYMYSTHCLRDTTTQLILLNFSLCWDFSAHTFVSVFSSNDLVQLRIHSQYDFCCLLNRSGELWPTETEVLLAIQFRQHVRLEVTGYINVIFRVLLLLYLLTYDTKGYLFY